MIADADDCSCQLAATRNTHNCNCNAEPPAVVCSASSLSTFSEHIAWVRGKRGQSDTMVVHTGIKACSGKRFCPPRLWRFPANSGEIHHCLLRRHFLANPCAARRSAGQVLDPGVLAWLAYTGQFCSVTLCREDLNRLTVLESAPTFDGDPQLLRLGLQAHTLGIADKFDPCFGPFMSRVDPLPHQLEAVHDYLRKIPRVRFLLADDEGPGRPSWPDSSSAN